jgi:hypothetical protein
MDRDKFWLTMVSWFSIGFLVVAVYWIITH